MPTFLARFLIILVVFLVLFLLRKFIKRLVFILVLLGVAFFIYGLFSPSGAAKLRYMVKTFPQEMASLFGGEAVLPYDDLNVGYQMDFSEEVVENIPVVEGDPLIDEPANSEMIASAFVISAMPSFGRADRIPAFSALVKSRVSKAIVKKGVVGSVLGTIERNTVVESQPARPPSSSVSASSNVTPAPMLSQQDIRDAEELFGMLLP